jgi:hypothetical protein
VSTEARGTEKTRGAGGTSDTSGRLFADLEHAHGLGVGAASAGLQDAALGALRLTGAGVGRLADAAVSSATPFLRAPLLARMSHVQRLHPSSGDEVGQCPTCGTPAPCETSEAVQW